MHEERFYRDWVKPQDLVSFNVTVGETDLYISADKDLSAKAKELITKYRRDIEDYMQKDPLFEPALVPVEVDKSAPDIVKDMAQAAREAGVGPMAAVAGAIAEFVGKSLLKYSSQVIVENGGDIFIKSLKTRKIGIYAGKSQLTGKLSLEIIAEKTPLGICTSAGSVGHSLSFGNADASIILSRSASLADAAATAVCNRVKKADDIESALEFAKSVKGVNGAVIIIGEKVGAWGDIKLV